VAGRADGERRGGAGGVRDHAGEAGADAAQADDAGVRGERAGRLAIGFGVEGVEGVAFGGLDGQALGRGRRGGGEEGGVGRGKVGEGAVPRTAERGAAAVVSASRAGSAA
jgi:hypothetical protein